MIRTDHRHKIRAARRNKIKVLLRQTKEALRHQADHRRIRVGHRRPARMGLRHRIGITGTTTVTGIIRRRTDPMARLPMAATTADLRRLRLNHNE
ncbi:MAG: hypothetical protein WDN29_08620 [Methylovirgula sp.]